MKQILCLLAFVFVSAAAFAQPGGAFFGWPGGAAFAQPVGAAEPANRVVIDGEYFYVHTVRPGETLYSLSRKYNVAQEEIVRNNPQAAEGLKAGEVVKIPAPEPQPLPRNIRNRTSSNRLVEVHTVNPGETAYSITRRYGVSMDDLIESNPGLDPTGLSIGQRILIPREVLGTSTPSEIDAEFARYAASLNEVADGWAYHLVEQGETLYSLTRRLGVSEQTLRENNPAELAGGLKFGSLLKYPAPVQELIAPSPEEWPVWGRMDSQPPKSFDTRRPLRVAMLLPFTVNGQEEASMADFYRGALIGLEELKADGISVNLSVHDTQRSQDATWRILRAPEQADVDLIIGPRYEAPFEEAARFASREGVPIVSPQNLVEIDDPFVYQVRPAPEHQYDKLRPYLTTDHNIVLITPTTGGDTDFLRAIERLLPPTVRRIAYNKSTSATTIGDALSLERENIIVVPTTDENTTDEVLAKISTIQNTLLSRTGRSYPIRVIGSPQWARLRNNDRELFFKLQAMYLTIYYADRTNPLVAAFDQRYLSAFGALPSLFSYRGYDVTKLFVTAIHEYGDRYAQSINRVNTTLLQVPYHFQQEHIGGKWINDEWALVRYRDDYIIEVK
ncbi:MAG: LysM peptidoglycan-binding domain-containing protein [Rikenellaceae bacterium]|jgi:LysM repeat protein/ABC-type branched-subunit amino acid transport system substrate-binding protein|nr:LysM peptidoglycan-binding domain-containing protein [Rikenellaceae bacterium]